MHIVTLSSRDLNDLSTGRQYCLSIAEISLHASPGSVPSNTLDLALPKVTGNRRLPESISLSAPFAWTDTTSIPYLLFDPHYAQGSLIPFRIKYQLTGIAVANPITIPTCIIHQYVHVDISNPYPQIPT